MRPIRIRKSADTWEVGSLMQKTQPEIDENPSDHAAARRVDGRQSELAHCGKFGNDPKPYVSKYVFPIQTEKVLALEIGRLENRKALLRSRPNSQPPLSDELAIPPELKLPDWVYPKRENREGLNMPISDGLARSDKKEPPEG